MTNEKEREWAAEWADAILDGLADSEYVICGENKNLLITDLLRIRSEAVKAELERCLASVHSKMKPRKDSDSATLIAMNAIYNQALDDAVSAILSDDQEANRVQR